MSDLFPGIVSVVPQAPPKPCAYPYFLVGYWPVRGWWRIHMKDMFKSPEDAEVRAKHLMDCGWTHVTIMKLPEGLWL